MNSSTGKPPRPRVLHGLTHLGLGGAEQVAFTLIRSLRDEIDFAVFAVRGVEAGVIGESMRAELKAMGVSLHVGTAAPIKYGGLVLAGWRAAQAVKRFQPDLIHLHTEIPEASHAMTVTLRPVLADIPLARTIHNSVYWHHWTRLGRWCERRMKRSHVACVSEDAREVFEQFRHESAAGPLPAAPTVIYNGVDVTDARSPRSRRDGESLRLLFAGRFESQKGADLLPEILSRVSLPGRRAVELVLHGHGMHEQRLRALAKRPPAGWTVHVLAPVPTLARQMPEFDLVLMPSRFEGLGLVAVEAALLGVPVVATDAPGLREALPPNHPWRARAGDVEDFARNLQRALEDRASWPEVARRAREFARARFDAGRMAGEYRRLYARALV